MKKLLALLLAMLMVLSLAACGEKAPKETDPPKVEDPGEASYMDQLIAAAKAEGTLVV